MIKATATVQAQHLLCPMPVIRLQTAVSQANIKDIIHVICTDPGTQHDIPAWCRVNQHQLIHKECVDYEFHYWVQVA